MRLLTMNAGSYPRIGETPELQQLRRTISAAEKGEATPEQLRAAEDALVRAAIQEQLDAGLDLVTDGQIRWHDPIAHLAGKFDGVEINGLLRYFDTNFYFRQPVVKGEIKPKNGLVLSEFEFARQNSAKPVKPVLTGPYTLARHSVNQHAAYKDIEVLTRAYTQALTPEIGALAKAGAEVIQVDEPAILKYPKDLPILQRTLLALTKPKLKAKILLYVYFGDPLPIYDRMQQLPVDVLGFDFTYNPKLVERVVSSGAQKPLAFGLVDARNTKLEDPEHLAHQIDRMLLRVKGEFCYLSPSCGLEFLPRDRALAKLKLLDQIRCQVKAAR
jgi:5-methyltetrahydropteroyltriglutamate--homocysteine methyltransferase